MKVVLWGGIGEKKSNGGTQYYQQNRIYDSDGLALCINADKAFHPWYLVRENDERRKDRRDVQTTDYDQALVEAEETRSPKGDSQGREKKKT